MDENCGPTWEEILNRNWTSFNLVCADMNEKGHDNKLDPIAWREYVLWDMQRRHNLDCGKLTEKVNG